ncbi:fungal-specific transcription factor domain-containing protein [Penicillium herquei]|nr:fungal-specific transcription factor domain-containing protein [Penicillium herquei]
MDIAPGAQVRWIDYVIRTGSNKVRKRVAQACQRCRQRKFKCDGLKPECSTCKQASQMCLYDSHIKRRGLPEGYVRGLELLASLAIRHIDNFEGLLLSKLSQTDEEHHFEWCSDFEDLLDGWRNSKLAVELENILPLLPSPKSQSVKRKFEDNQNTTEGPRRFGTHALTPQPIHPIDESLPLEDEHVELNSYAPEFPAQSVDNLNPVSDHQPPQERTMTSLSAQSTDTSPINVGLPAQFGSLVRIYFAQTHCWLPIVDKTEMMRSTYRYINRQAEVIPNSGTLALIWGIAASTSSQLLKSGHLEQVFGTDYASSQLVSSFYSKCREFIPSDEGPFEIKHAQALLLLSLMDIDKSAWSTAWMRIGKAVRIITGLNSPSFNTTLAQQPIPRLKETSLGCFVLDTLVAFHLSVPPHLREDDVDQIGSIDEDGLDEWDVWSNPLDTAASSQNQHFPLFTLSSFNRLVNICNAIQALLLSSLHGKSFSQYHILESLQRQSPNPPFDSIFKMQKKLDFDESEWLPHHYHLRLIFLLFLAEISPQRNTITDNEDTTSQFLEKSICLTEIQTHLDALRDRFGVHSVPQTCSLITNFSSKSQLPIGNKPDIRPPAIPCDHNTPHTSMQGNINQNTRINPHLSDLETNHAVSQLDPELQHHDALTDSNSIFNDFVAIDTSKWASNWEEGLFNLGFTANSSANDFYEFIEPNT